MSETGRFSPNAANKQRQRIEFIRNVPFRTPVLHRNRVRDAADTSRQHGSDVGTDLFAELCVHRNHVSEVQ